MLHRRGVELAADAREQRFARVALVAQHPHLDELVREKIDVDFVQDSGRQPMLPDRDDRMKRMRLRPKGTALRRC